MDKHPEPPEGSIFVFGSNLAGRHGKGAARAAANHHGAIYGQGEGLQGNSYGIPTKDARIRTLPLHQIEWHVMRFLEFARDNPQLQFFVTRVGCGLAGYRDDQISTFFEHATENCILPDGWR